MRRSLWVLALSFFIIAAAVQGNVQAQSSTRYYPETGFSVSGAFLEFYESAPNALLLFGYPVSGEIDHPDGNTYQYFQQARFDLVMGDNGPQVQLFSLGEAFYTPGGSVPALNTNSPACRRFDTGYSVCYSFLRFYDNYQGAAYFGAPISDLEIRDSRYVQYFEKVRMEWRPDSASGEVVGLTHLGTIYMHEHDRVPLSTDPQPGTSGAVNPVRLQAHAFVTHALIPANGTQTVYIIVQDQLYKPVENAMVAISVYYPDGSQYDVRAPATDAGGISQISFHVPEMEVRQVVRVEVRITYQTSSTEASTWFRSWW
jgi:hypothetical protein